MRKKFLFILLALAMSCSLVLAVACEEKGGETPAPGPDDESVVYEGDMLYNGFEDQGDLYRIKQLFDWDYTPLGKLEIVGADNFLMREDASEEQAAADAVSAMIAQLPAADTVTAFSLSLKQQITAARCAYGALSDAAKRLVVGLEALEALEANGALAGVYTLADLGGDFTEDIPAATPWLGYRAPLADPMRGTVVFRAGGFAETDGAFYISLFHEGNTSNAGDGIMLYLRNFTEANGTPRYELRPQNSTDEGIPFEDENGDPVKLSASETYTFTLGYEVEEDFSALTFSVRMEDAAGNVVAEGSQTVDSFTLATAKGETFPYDAAQTVESWLGGEGALAAHANLFLDAGNSTGVHIESAWQVPAASDYAEPSEEADPHDPADLSPRQGEGALRVYYEQGSFTQILARFDDSALSGMPVEELGGFSVKIYNDSAAERQVTLALMREENVPMVVEGGDLTLAPYAWTECKVTFNPYIVDALADELIGLTLLFDETQESVYYVDDWRVQFGQTPTPEQEELMGEVSSLVEDIAAQLGDRVTVDDKEMLEALYARYLALPEEWHPLITNSADLFEAIDDYLYARAGSGSSGTDALIFEEVLGLRQLGSVTGAAASYSEEEHPVGAEGSLRLDFDGTTDWTYVPVTPVMGLEYDEVHIWVNNVSDKARAFYINWQMADAAYGACVTGGNVQNGYVIPANSGWVELVYRSNTFAITELEMVTLNANNAATASEGTLYIGNVTLTGAVPAVIGAIDALADYEADYSDADKAAVAAARAAYDALTEQQKAQVGNIAKLVSLEADIWREGFAALPATPAEMTEYTKEYAAAVEGLQTAYAALDEAVQALVAEEHALLAEFAARLEALFAELAAENVTGMIDALAEYSAAYTDADRAAVAAARAAYDALSAEDKAEVSNAAKLFALEADIWREGFAALPAVEELNAYSENWAAWQAAVAALREGYAALDASVHASVAEDRALLEAYEAKVTELNALLGEIGDLNEDIAAIAGETITEASRDLLEGLYARYTALGEDYRAMVTDYAALASAVRSYLALVTVPNAEGETTVLHFDQPLGAAQVDPIVVGNARLGYAEESPDGVGGSLRVDYDGTATEVDLPVGAIAAAGYEEVRVWVKNDSDAKRGVWLLNGGAWVTAKAAYGEGVEDGNLAGGFVIPAESGWIELVYDASVFTDGLTGFATGSLDEGNAIVASVGTLYIGRVTLVSASDAVETMIASLAAYAPGYPDADKAAVAAARAAYDALTEQQKAQVGNIAKLVSLEADIWREGFAALPALDAFGEYSEAAEQAIRALRTGYAALDPAVQEAVREDEARLAAYEARLEELIAARRVEYFKELVAALKAYSADYTEEDRAAVAAARAQYVQLTQEQQAQVAEEAAKLFALEADLFAGDVAALEAALEGAVYSAALEESAVSLRAAYAALDASVLAEEDVVAAEATLQACEETVAQLKADHEAALEETEALVSEIAAVGTVTAESKGTLEDLYSRYNALPEAYRGSVTNYAALQTAIAQYLAAVTVPNENGETTVLHFDELLGETQWKVSEISAGANLLNTSYSATESAQQIDFMSAARIDADLDFVPTVSLEGYDEVHLWVRNTTQRQMFIYLDWKGSDAAYGDTVAGGNLSAGGYLIDGNAWTEVVYKVPKFYNEATGLTQLAQLNLAAIETENGLSGSLFVGKMVLVDYSERLNGMVDALPEGDLGSYTLAQIKQIKQAQEVYETLTAEEKTAFDATDRGEKLAACISAVANYHTLSDLTATTSGYYGTKNLATGNAVTIGSWDYAAAALPSFADTRSATIVFKASGLAAMDGAMYISLFHDGSANAGQASDGVTFQLNAGSVQSLTTGGGSYNNESGMTVSTAETYTFYVGYTIAENYSSVTINIRIVASDGSVLVTFEHKAETIAPFSTGQGVVGGVNYGTVDLGGSQTIAAWLSTHANTANHQTLYLNGGNSSSVTVSDAW